ncbi:Fc.00g092880.m01.CDS01 [Cosmosporella sp. VM-42]
MALVETRQEEDAVDFRILGTKIDVVFPSIRAELAEMKKRTDTLAFTLEEVQKELVMSHLNHNLVGQDAEEEAINEADAQEAKAATRGAEEAIAAKSAALFDAMVAAEDHALNELIAKETRRGKLGKKDRERYDARLSNATRRNEVQASKEADNQATIKAEENVAREAAQSAFGMSMCMGSSHQVASTLSAEASHRERTSPLGGEDFTDFLSSLKEISEQMRKMNHQMYELRKQNVEAQFNRECY